MGTVGKSRPERQGMVLAYVLGILALLGLLAGKVFLQVRNIDMVSSRDHQDVQREALLESALSHCRARWRADSLLGAEEWSDMVWLAVGRVGYRVHVRPWGALVRVDVRMFVGSDTSVTRTVVVGGSVRNDSIPALGILEGGQNLEILPGTSIHGDYWGNGAVSSTFGKSVWNGAVRPERWSSMRSLMPRPEVVQAWWQNADVAWKTRSALAPELAISQWIQDTCDVSGAISETELRCDGLLRIRGARFRNVVALARNIRIEGANELDDVILAAREGVVLRGRVVVEGQILAKDSMSIATEVLDGPRALFHVLGTNRPNPQIPGDSVSESRMRVSTPRGSGLVVYGGATKNGSRQARFVSDSTTRWTGLWLSGGGATPRGELTGGLVAEFLLRKDLNGVPWEGRIEKIRVTLPNHRSILLLPWTGAGEPAIWSVR